MSHRKRRNNFDWIVLAFAAVTIVYCTWTLVTEEEPLSTWIQNPP